MDYQTIHQASKLFRIHLMTLAVHYQKDYLQMELVNQTEQGQLQKELVQFHAKPPDGAAEPPKAGAGAGDLLPKENAMMNLQVGTGVAVPGTWTQQLMASRQVSESRADCKRCGWVSAEVGPAMSF
jgi:hypothetical protein